MSPPINTTTPSRWSHTETSGRRHEAPSAKRATTCSTSARVAEEHVGAVPRQLLDRVLTRCDATATAPQPRGARDVQRGGRR